MHFHHLSPSFVLSFILTVALTAPAYRAALDINGEYLNCSKSFQCGNINTGYPFWGQERQQYCGLSGFKLDCISGVPQIFIKMENYRVLGVNNRSQTLTVARADLWNNICPTSFFNTTLDLNLFNYTSDTRSLMLYYNCPLIGELSRSRFNCGANGTNLTSYYVTSDLMSSFGDRLRNCSNSIVVYAYQTSILGLENLSMDLVTALNTGFGLQWNVNNNFSCESCVESFGQCGTDPSSNQFTCYCPDQAYSSRCPAIRVKTGPVIWLNMQNSNVNTGKVVSLFGGVSGSIVIYFICMRTCCNRRKNDKNLEEFIRNQRSLGPRRYTYREVKRMTKSFKMKLGQGGYGTVYKGKLPDGRLVAVKVLSDSKGNGEDFMNEVASISKTSHVNIVNLLGFCYDKKRRALIYEFMPNGSLDKYIYDAKSPSRIEWKTLYEIAVGIARGLEYLHLGCNTRILHFDIKPNNILLDENFCPKISDFGLAKLCERRESSTISMLGARGTIGFIAPEVFCRFFGGVSHKSDVYSYGMMVLEMVGGRKNFDARASQTSEEYFPDWIHKQLEPSENLRVRGYLSDEEEETVRKMILVSLWCIQTNPADRPSMTKVVEMLSASLQSLPIPPKPNLSSSSSTTSSADEEPSSASSSEVVLSVEEESTSLEEVHHLNSM